jgi:Zn-dependent M28 family amino/carboxypeptidase
VLLGAHYDHLGRGGGGNSLAGKEEQNEVHHGADDNASGTAAVLDAARRLAADPPRRPVAVAFWSGEELGLLGANAFLEQAVLPPEELAAYVNLDMVGRPRDNKLTLQAAGSSSVWPGLVERSNVPVGFDLTLNEDPYLPTDSAAFNLASIPTLNLFSGSHEDYHRPSDTADKIDYEGLDRVATLTSLIARRVAALDTPPDFLKVEPKRQEGGDRDTVRAFTGTIPDYATEVEGLLLSGVIDGGPADEAGLRGGDVIVEFAGHTIANIYDNTYALDAVKIDVPVKVVVERDGERVEVTITPRARN